MAPVARRRHSSTSSDSLVVALPLTGEPDDLAAPPTQQVITQPAAQQLEAAAAAVASMKSTITKRKRSRLFFNPSDAFCHWWSGIVSLAFLYNFWSLSYRFAFREIDSSTVTIWFLLDYTADLIYVNDIWVNFRTGHLEDGVLQREPQKIGQHYRDSTLFYLDTLCLLPFDFLYLSFGYCSIMRCNKLVKIYKFWSFVDRTERHTNYPNVFRTFALVHYILVIFHWNACLFHMISKHKIIDIESLYKINDNQCDDISCQYLHAFYWSTLALTLIGDLPRPRTRGEYIYVIVELVFGLFLFASVLGHVANIVTNVSAARKEFQAKLDSVKTFMRTRRVSDELQNKVIRWFDYLWLSQKSSDEEKSVACLPDRLKAEIAIHVNLDTLKRVDIFQNTEAGFLCELVLRLKPVLFSPGDYVCRKNEVGHEMYIVSRGILEVVTEDGRQTVVATFRAGSYFGEIAVLNVGLAGNKRTASVRSVGYSDLFCLSKRDLWDVLKDYPNAEARIRAVAEERLSMLEGGGGGSGSGNGNGSAGKRASSKQVQSDSRVSPTHSSSWTSVRSQAGKPARPEVANGRSMRGRMCSSNATTVSPYAQQPLVAECSCRTSGCALHPTLSSAHNNYLSTTTNPYHHHLSEYPHQHYFDAPPPHRPRPTRHHYNYNQHHHHSSGGSTSAYTIACPHQQQQQQLAIAQGAANSRRPHLSDSKSIDHQLAHQHRHGCPAGVTQFPAARGRHRDTEPDSSSSMAPAGCRQPRLSRRSSSLVAVPGALPVEPLAEGCGEPDYANKPARAHQLAPGSRLEPKSAGLTGSSRASLSSTTLLCQQAPVESSKSLARATTTTTTSDSLSSLTQSVSQRGPDSRPEVGVAAGAEKQEDEQCGGGGGESVRIQID